MVDSVTEARKRQIARLARPPTARKARALAKSKAFQDGAGLAAPASLAPGIAPCSCSASPEHYDCPPGPPKRGFMLVNTSRGALVDAEALIDGLKSGQIGAAALDVYEQEADVFFEDLSDEIIQDDVLQRLLTFPNVLITGHQAYFTRDALANIAKTTLDSITAFARGEPLANRVAAEHVTPASV